MPLTPNHKKEARRLLANYCERVENNRANIHYRQFRPMNHLGKTPESIFSADCSGLTTGAFYWVDQFAVKHSLGFRLHDPNGPRYHYNGYGYTGTLLANNTKGRVPLDHLFWVGDMAFFGSSLSYTKHVIICRKNGYRRDALWTSHGQEAGPYSVYLDYRPDLLVVLRAYDLR